MKTSQKKLIKFLHESLSKDWKTIIECEFPKLFIKKELELNNWFVDDEHTEWMMFFTSDGYMYGFNGIGEWTDKDKTNYNPNDQKQNRHATKEEINSRLEAKRREFKDEAECIFNGIKEHLTTEIKRLDYIEQKLSKL